jgi:DNA-binding XRE family transcriptional regulator/predicted RNase H-like HicB family nuclease
MLQYTAITTREKARTLIEFPDCPGAETFAEANEDPAAVARESLELYLESVLADREVPPRPSAVRLPQGWALLPISIDPALEVRLQIRWTREDQGLSQQALAQRVDVSQQAIAKLESPDSNVTLETLKKVAAALGLEVHVELAPATAARS